MKYQIKVEYSRDKFVKFYKDVNYTDGKIKNYDFRELVDDIKRNCTAVQHLSTTTMRIRYKDEDGHFVNLNEEDEENFRDVFQSTSVAGDSVYRRIYLKVSEMESPMPDQKEKKRKLDNSSGTSSARQCLSDFFPEPQNEKTPKSSSNVSGSSSTPIQRYLEISKKRYMNKKSK